MIHVTDVSKSYGPVRAVDGVSLDAGEGEVVLLLGSNGAGKSTLIRSILGVVAYEGTIRVSGLDPLRHGKAVRQLIGYMPQAGGLHPDLTVDETMRFYAALRRVDLDGEDRGRALLAMVGLEDAGDVRVEELSGGMRQRLGFAVAQIGDPPVLVLDEPTASLDARSRERLAERIRALAAAGKTILVSTHADHELVHVADRALVMEEGRVVSDTAVGARREAMTT